MKNLFGFSIKGKDPWPLPEPDGSEFIVKRIDGGMRSRLDVMERENENVRKTANFPPWLTNVFGIILLCGALLLAIALELIGGENTTYEIAISSGFWWFIGFGAGLALLAIAFFIMQYFKNKSVMNSSAVKDHVDRYERVKREALDSMLVPPDAVPLDVFAYPYRMKDGKKRGVLPARSHANIPFYAFRDGEALCLADVSYVARIPYDSIASLSRICKKTMFVGWNKAEQYNKGAFKPYKIRCNSYGQMYVKFCYRVEIRGGETFELLIPPYEFESLAPMLGHKAQSIIDVKE